MTIKEFLLSLEGRTKNKETARYIYEFLKTLTADDRLKVIAFMLVGNIQHVPVFDQVRNGDVD